MRKAKPRDGGLGEYFCFVRRGGAPHKAKAVYFSLGGLGDVRV